MTLLVFAGEHNPARGVARQASVSNGDVEDAGENSVRPECHRRTARAYSSGVTP